MALSLLQYFALCTCLYLITPLEITFTAITDLKVIIPDATLTCSVTDFISSTSTNNYWIEFESNRSISNNVYANTFNHNLKQYNSFKITSETGLNTTSNALSCTNHKNSNIFSSYTIAYKNYSTSPLPTTSSVYYKIYSQNSQSFSEEMIAINGLISPYTDKYPLFNYNLNAGSICNNDWYLISWYHWDQFETYLQYKISYMDTNNNYKSSSIISAKQTLIYNVSAFVSSFGRSKTFKSK
eukprot:482059_1